MPAARSPRLEPRANRITLLLMVLLLVSSLDSATSILPDTSTTEGVAERDVQYEQLIDQIFPAKRISEFLPDTATLLKYDKIIVAGPQRSGTTFTSAYLSHLLNYTFLDEQTPTTYLHDEGGHEFLCNGCHPSANPNLPNFFKATERVVAHRPDRSSTLHLLPEPEGGSKVLVIFMARNCIDVFKSQNKVFADKNKGYIGGGWTCKYGRGSEMLAYWQQDDLHPYFDPLDLICKVKQDVWVKYQRDKLALRENVDTLTLDYESLKGNTTKFLDKELRKDFQAKQISLSSPQARARRRTRRRRVAASQTMGSTDVAGDKGRTRSGEATSERDAR